MATGQTPGPQSVTDLVRQMPTKRGLAIIITNDYSSSAPNVVKLRRLQGPQKDGARMQTVFNQLNIATYWKHNVRHGELSQVLYDVARHGRWPKSYGSISFLFSGHGLPTGNVYLQDGSQMHVQEIVDFLLPKKAPNIGTIPKLFFIDVCRGSNNIQPVVVPRGSGQHAQAEILRRGATDETVLDTVFIPPEGNTLVAYSTTSSFKAHEEPSGGIWMQALASKLITSKQAVETVLTEVRSDLHKKYQHPGWQDHMQMPVTINTLLEPVYLNPASIEPALPPGLPLPGPPSNDFIPGQLTQRDNQHPGYYRGKLLNMEQHGVIANTQEQYQHDGTNYICTLTFVSNTPRRQFKFQSERPLKSKQEAKESAAKKAVLSLDPEEETGAKKTSSPPKANSSRGGASALTSPGNNPISRLKEDCEQKKIPEPVYKEVKCGEQRFSFRVTVAGRTFAGAEHGNKKDAKKDAAQKAVDGLKI